MRAAICYSTTHSSCTPPLLRVPPPASGQSQCAPSMGTCLCATKPCNPSFKAMLLGSRHT
eukprot:6198398-Amphidinium_carterae.1